MVNGTIVYSQFPITVDVNAPADTSFQQSGIVGQFPSPRYEIIAMKIMQTAAHNGVSKSIVLVTARDTT